MIKLKSLIKESMTLQVAGNNSSRYDRLLDLAAHLETLAYRILEKLPEDQRQYFQKNRPSELLTIDGLADMDGPTGVLNLYYSGYTGVTLKAILKVVFERLKELKIETGKVKMEQSGMFKYKVIRIPIVKNDSKYEGAPEVNMSNRNAYHVFHNILQFDPEAGSNGSAFSFTAQELKSAIETILKHDPNWITKNQIHKFDSDWPEAERGDNKHENPHDAIINQLSGDGVRSISMGLDSDDILDRLYGILNVADWAIEHGKSDLYVA